MIPLSVPEISPCDGFCDKERRGEIEYSSSWVERDLVFNLTERERESQLFKVLPRALQSSFSFTPMKYIPVHSSTLPQHIDHYQLSSFSSYSRFYFDLIFINPYFSHTSNALQWYHIWLEKCLRMFKFLFFHYWPFESCYSFPLPLIWKPADPSLNSWGVNQRPDLD